MGYFLLFKTHWRALGFGFFTAFFSGLGQTHFLALFNPHVMATFSLSHAQYGSLYSFVTLLSGFFMTALGTYFDRWDLRFCGALTALGLVIGQLLIYQQGSLFLLGTGLFCLRLFGQGLCSSLSSIAISRYFQSNRGKALALTQLGFPAYEGIMTPIFAALLIWGGFSFVNLSLVIVVLCFYLPLTVTLTRGMPNFNLPQIDASENHPAGNSLAKTELGHTTARRRDWTRAQVISDRTLYFILPQALMPPFALTGLLFHQLAISESKGWSPTLMASGLLFFAIGRTLNSFITGPLVDRWQAWRLFPFYQVPLAIGFLIMALGDGRWVPGLAFLFFGLAVGSGGPIKSAIWAELYGIRHLGAIKSFFATIMIFSTATSPALFGWWIQTQGHPFGLLSTMAILSLMAALLAWWGLGSFFKQFSQAG